jgi:hypothetical protein
MAFDTAAISAISPQLDSFAFNGLLESTVGVNQPAKIIKQNRLIFTSLQESKCPTFATPLFLVAKVGYFVPMNPLQSFIAFPIS